MTLILLSFAKKFWPYILAAVVVLGGVYYVYGRGEAHVKVAIAKQVAVIQQKANAVTTNTVIQYVDRVQVIHDKAQVIIKKVPVYVTQYDDSRCVINTGFVSMWNAADSGLQLSDAPGSADESPSGVSLSRVAEQHDNESEYTHQLEAQLISLQAWVVAQQKVAQH